MSTCGGLDRPHRYYSAVSGRRTCIGCGKSEPPQHPQDDSKLLDEVGDMIVAFCVFNANGDKPDEDKAHELGRQIVERVVKSERAAVLYELGEFLGDRS